MFVPHLLNPLTMYVAHSIPKNMMIIILNFSFVDLPKARIPRCGGRNTTGMKKPTRNTTK